MATLPKIYNDYTIEKYLKDLFTINYDDHKYYQPTIIELLQNSISQIDVTKDSDKLKVGKIYEVLLQYMTEYFYNSSVFFSSMENISASVKNGIYVNHMDIFIVENNTKVSNKYSLLCTSLGIPLSAVQSNAALFDFIVTKDKRTVVFYRINGAYKELQKIISTGNTSIEKIIFKIYAYGSFCSIIYTHATQSLEFLYSNYEEEDVAFDKKVLIVLSKTLFTLQVDFLSINLKNIDDDQFNIDYNFIKDIKNWICLFLTDIAPDIDTTTIVNYINILPYHIRDIFYIQVILFIFKKSKYLQTHTNNYSDLIQELMNQETIHVNGIASEVQTTQTGGTRTDNFTQHKQKTFTLIRNLFSM